MQTVLGAAPMIPTATAREVLSVAGAQFDGPMMVAPEWMLTKGVVALGCMPIGEMFRTESGLALYVTGLDIPVTGRQVLDFFIERQAAFEAIGKQRLAESAEPTGSTAQPALQIVEEPDDGFVDAAAAALAIPAAARAETFPSVDVDEGAKKAV